MREVNPCDTTRAYAFDMWMKAPMPIVTFFKTLDVSRLVRISRRRGLKFNMLMVWCIGKAASQVKEFYMLPVDGKLIQYDSIAVNTIVANRRGEVSSCDIPFPAIYWCSTMIIFVLPVRLLSHALTMILRIVWWSEHLYWRVSILTEL